MFKFIYKSLHHVRSSIRPSPTPALTPTPIHNLYFLQIHLFSSASPKSIRNPQNQDSFTVNYFINSCRFRQEKALSASKYVKFESPERPDAVLAFFKNQGLTKTQILNLIRTLPPVLVCDPEKSLLPKFDFFKSKGISSTEIAIILLKAPSILKRSLEKQIIPSYEFFCGLLLSEQKTIAAIKRFSGILLFDLKTHLIDNIEILREAGVPNEKIISLMTYQPRALMTNTDTFRQTVEEVEKMGFDPSRLKFVIAVLALRAMTKSTWEKKVEVYKKWGWSEDVIYEAFGKHPWCMIVSKEKIMGVMDVFVNKMGCESSLIARRPGLISLSLEKRIVPRCAVGQVLLSKGKIKITSLSRMLESPESIFLEKYVNCHVEEAPDLLKLYEEKLNLQSN